MPSIAESESVWNRDFHESSDQFKKLVAHATRSAELHDAGKIKAGSYLLADFTDLSFPYKKPDSALRSWERVNGRKRVIIQPGPVLNRNGEIEYIYPYGIVPRLFLIWLTTEIKMTQSRTVEIGRSVNALRRQLGISRGGKQHENFTRQLEALFAANIVIYEEKQDNEANATALKGRTLHIADSWEIWKANGSGEISEKIPSTLEVTESFYLHVQKTAVPLVSEIVTEFKRDPMRLDIYCWLVHRLYTQRAPESHVAWWQLAKQFGGSDYTRERKFRKIFKDHLQIVRMYYPEAKIAVTKDGLILRRSKLHIPPRGRQPKSFSITEIVSVAAELEAS